MCYEYIVVIWFSRHGQGHSLNDTLNTISESGELGSIVFDKDFLFSIRDDLVSHGYHVDFFETANKHFVFRIKDSDSYFFDLMTRLEQYENEDKLHYSITAQIPLYTKEEYENANWYQVCSVNYPFTTRYINLSGEDVDVDINACARQENGKAYSGPYPRHYVQIRPFRVSRSGKWRNKFFGGAYISPGILFCSDTAKEMMENQLTGAEYLPVFSINGKKEYPDVFQLRPTHQLSAEAFDAAHDAITYKCSGCGMKMFRRKIPARPVRYGIREEYIEGDFDFYATLPCEDEIERELGNQVIVMSKRAYKFLVDNKMTRGLRIYPLETLNVAQQ